MTTPQGPSRGNPPEWNRPTEPGPGRRPAPPPPPPPPSGSPTQRIPHGGRPNPPPPPPNRPQPPGRQQPPAARPYAPANPPAPAPDQPVWGDQATTRLPTPPPPPPEDAPAAKTRRRRPKALVLGIVLAVVVALVIGAELLIRHLAGNKVASAVACEVEDSATVSFAAMPPMLWQYLSDSYPSISVRTAGNQVRSAKGMKVSIDIKDLRLSDSGNSKGTIGSLNGTITWSSDGIKQSVQDAIPVLGSFVTSKVTTNPGDGTIELKGMLDSVTVKPHIVNNGLSLQVVNLTALGSKMSTDTVQSNLDSLTSKATQNYPVGIHADTVKVTDSGLEATFSTTNASIPASSSNGQDCFSGL
ncbi:LmeA family phospholipid-binding protein [Mycobacterium sp. Z3061]|uniref:LmeA family phospholipid-binding protein n=1 Tax=Mycobacterium sp. Z3061 TaxID=3073562 RepID=UPI002877F3C2|nr:DUF2993 domain-containing protein [Mycobacterium sp. Z3061]